MSQNDSEPTIDFLLKQVYAVHKKQVKGLEAENRHLTKLNRSLQNELYDLKQQHELLLKESTLRDNRSTPQKCPSAANGTPMKVESSPTFPNSNIKITTTASNRPSPSKTVSFNITFVPETLFPDESVGEERTETSDSRTEPASPNVIADSPKDVTRTPSLSTRRIRSFQSTELQPSVKEKDKRAETPDTEKNEDNETSCDPGSPTLCGDGFLFMTPRPSTKPLRVEELDWIMEQTTSHKRIGDDSIPGDKDTKRICRSSKSPLREQTARETKNTSLDETMVAPELIRQYRDTCKSMDADFFDIPESSDEELPEVKTLFDCKDRNLNNKPTDHNKVPPHTKKFSYVFKNDPVRKKDERMKLNGYSCKSCREYYVSTGLNEQEIQERLKNSSRHRHKCPPPPATPTHFWSDFIETPDVHNSMYIPGKAQQRFRNDKRRPLDKTDQ